MSLTPTSSNTKFQDSPELYSMTLSFKKGCGWASDLYTEEAIEALPSTLSFWLPSANEVNRSLSHVFPP